MDAGVQHRRAMHMAESARRDVDTATVAEVRAILDDYEHREEAENHTDAA